MKYIMLATLGIGVHYDSMSLYKDYTYAGDRTRVLPLPGLAGRGLGRRLPGRAHALPPVSYCPPRSCHGEGGVLLYPLQENGS